MGAGGEARQGIGQDQSQPGKAKRRNRACLSKVMPQIARARRRCVPMLATTGGASELRGAAPRDFLEN